MNQEENSHYGSQCQFSRPPMPVEQTTSADGIDQPSTTWSTTVPTGPSPGADQAASKWFSSSFLSLASVHLDFNRQSLLLYPRLALCWGFSYRLGNLIEWHFPPLPEWPTFPRVPTAYSLNDIRTIWVRAPIPATAISPTLPFAITGLNHLVPHRAHN